MIEDFSQHHQTFLRLYSSLYLTIRFYPIYNRKANKKGAGEGSFVLYHANYLLNLEIEPRSDTKKASNVIFGYSARNRRNSARFSEESSNI